MALVTATDSRIGSRPQSVSSDLPAPVGWYSDWVWTDPHFLPAVLLGLVYGYVAWPLMFRLVGPVYRLTKWRDNTPVPDPISHCFIVAFLLSVTMAVLGVLGWAFVTRQPGRKEFGFLFLGSWAGMLLSGLISRVEHDLRRRMTRRRASRRPTS